MLKHWSRLVKRVRREDGFTLVELLVVVAIIVALAAASVVSVTKFAGKGQEGSAAAELQSVQAAMDTMMADKQALSVTANADTLASGIKDFSAVPSQGALATYLRQNPTTYWYCWDGTGKVKQLLAAGACPAGTTY